MSEIMVPVSPGEVIDKITILRIKSARMTDAEKLTNVRRELHLLEKTWAESPYGKHDISMHEAALQAVNERLWDIEDRIRDQERIATFDATFISLARSVYIENDERAVIKKRINVTLGSTIVEEKSYAAYR
jgi:hypothetical protein